MVMNRRLLNSLTDESLLHFHVVIITPSWSVNRVDKLMLGAKKRKTECDPSLLTSGFGVLSQLFWGRFKYTGQKPLCCLSNPPTGIRGFVGKKVLSPKDFIPSGCPNPVQTGFYIPDVAILCQSSTAWVCYDILPLNLQKQEPRTAQRCTKQHGWPNSYDAEASWSLEQSRPKLTEMNVHIVLEKIAESQNAAGMFIYSVIVGDLWRSCGQPSQSVPIHVHSQTNLQVWEWWDPNPIAFHFQ